MATNIINLKKINEDRNSREYFFYLKDAESADIRQVFSSNFRYYSAIYCKMWKTVEVENSNVNSGIALLPPN